MTNERKVFNEEVLPYFIQSFVEENKYILDIGKPDEGWGYRQMFSKCKYQTLDKNINLQPDICIDLEKVNSLCGSLRSNSLDYAVAMGLWEQCNNPFKLLDGIHYILKTGGFALFGIMSVGYPLVQATDNFRFTPIGVENLLGYRWRIYYFRIVKREKVPAYIFVICEKV